MTTLKLGSRGTEVKTLQGKLHLIADGIFGEITEDAVKDFQRSKGLRADGIVGAQTWAALGASTTTRTINEIIVHCTATPEGRDYSVEQIRQMHLQRGFSDIGYHWLIGLDGSIRKGRDEAKIGAHCLGHNSYSIGISYVGGVGTDCKTAKDTRTAAQKKALLALVREIKTRYPNATTHGHYEFANKACPSFDVAAWKKETGIR
jgi:N-acetylmuramoyl-L-alanine amidase